MPVKFVVVPKSAPYIATARWAGRHTNVSQVRREVDPASTTVPSDCPLEPIPENIRLTPEMGGTWTYSARMPNDAKITLHAVLGCSVTEKHHASKPTRPDFGGFGVHTQRNGRFEPAESVGILIRTANRVQSAVASLSEPGQDVQRFWTLRKARIG